MKKLLLALSLFVSVQAMAQSDYDVSKDKENGAVVFKGQMTFDDLKKESSFSWLQRGADAYKPDSASVAFLKKQLPKYNFVVLMGTWCDDSQTLVPKFYKVLLQAGVPMNKLAMYGVDRAKQAKYIEHKLYKLDKVPTIIVVRNNNEVGRIVETTKKNIEMDLVNIIQKDLDAQELRQ